jgi:hypothetical protein
MPKTKQPTCTSLILAALRERDDFMTYRMLREATGLDVNQVSASCFHLRNRRAIGVEVLPDGSSWWYPLPPEEDNRSRIQEHRTPESRPRKARKPRKEKK